MKFRPARYCRDQPRSKTRERLVLDPQSPGTVASQQQIHKALCHLEVVNLCLTASSPPPYNTLMSANRVPVTGQNYSIDRGQKVKLATLKLPLHTTKVDFQLQ
ncbi:hypothetical protein OTU49_009249 [Cherax quadricarinatus]|uniref:Uncharacterized protein n=1 Tax=Cherax quadricarinatus TaxID=27406 RepID=A0AAW0WKP6_CHEQU